MHRRQRWIVTLGLALIIGMITPGSATAGASYQWSFDTRPDGLPATAEPAQSLTSAGVGLHVDGETAELDGVVDLGAEPDASTAAVLRVSVGVPTESGCRTTWSLEVPTDDPTGPAARAGTRISLAAAFAMDTTDYSERCGSVSLLAAGTGTVLDRLDAHDSGMIISDPPSTKVQIRSVEDTRVRPHHWERLWLKVHYFGLGADRVTVQGAGEHVTVRRSHEFVALESGATVRVPAYVRLDVERRSKVALVVRTDGGNARPASTSVRAVLTPR